MGFEKEDISYEQLLKMINQLSTEDKQRLIQDLTSQEIEKAIHDEFKKYEEVFKALA